MLLHGTRERFASFRIPTSETHLSGASNGMLGVWFCRESHAFIAEGYGRGGWVAAIEEPCDTAVAEVPLALLARWHDEADRDDACVYYRQIRETFLGRGKSWIAIMEKDGSSPTLICLAPQDLEIASWRQVQIPEQDIAPTP